MKRIINPEKSKWKAILARPELERPNLNAVVKEVFDEVAEKGDAGVKVYVKQFQGFEGSFLVSKEEIERAKNELSDELKSAIQVAASNIKRFHAAQTDEGMCLDTMEGVHCWRKSKPIQKVGLYIPGGTAPLFSTVLMLGIPAKLAGCEE
ncbi:MAG: histidinol dehydrogenase, partial [Crocinitomicaceae bacterium]